MFGAEYETHTDSNSTSDIHEHHILEALCAVCHVSNGAAVYIVPAKYTCPSGWTREYYGYLIMMSLYRDRNHHRTQYTCVDATFTSVPGTSANLDGLLFHFNL